MIKYTIGEAIDKLAVINLKIWHLEEEMIGIKTNEQAGIIGDKIVGLNKRRMEIIEAINQEFTNDN